MDTICDAVLTSVHLKEVSCGDPESVMEGRDEGWDRGYVLEGERVEV